MAKKAISELYKVGDLLQLEFLQNEETKKLLAKTKEGIVCFIDTKEQGPIVRKGSTWDCEITIIKEKFLIIKPKILVYTPTQNEQLAGAKAKELFGSKDKSRNRKAKANYPFLRSTDKK